MATARIAIRPPTDDLPIASTAFLAARNVIRVGSVPVAQAHTPAPQTAPYPWPLALLVAAAALVAIGLSLWAITSFLPDGQYDGVKAAVLGGPAAAGTLSMFATFYVAAQAIERLLEPLSNALLNKDSAEGKYASKVDEAATKAEDLAKLASAGNSTPAELATAKGTVETALMAVAAAKNGIDLLTQARTATFWALATVAGIAASASLKLYFLVLVGISPAPRWMEVLATGLIIGSGTKPIHDLISAISEKKEAAAAASAVANVSAGG